jgi:hypothetical protein
MGFYDLNYGELRKVKLEHYSSQIRWRLENGEHAHFQVEWNLTYRGEITRPVEKLLRSDRAAARTMIAGMLKGPFKYDAVDPGVDFELPELPR